MTKSEFLEANIKALTIFSASTTIFTLQSCANYLNVHPNTIKNRIAAGIIEAKLEKGKYSIPKLQFLIDIVHDFEQELQTAS